MYEIACCISRGIKEKNDDRIMIKNQVICDGSHCINSPNGYAIVADGVGGELFGNEAAEIAASYFANLKNPEELLKEDTVRKSVEDVNQLIIEKQKDFKHTNMSTTLAGLLVNNDSFTAFNVGDSRIYRFRNPYISLLSKDHTLNQEREDMGLPQIPEYEHVITRYLGGNKAQAEVILGRQRALKDDIFLICSDGISDVLTEDDLCECLKINGDLKVLSEEIVEEASKRGSLDNMSVVLIRRKDNG